MTLIKPLAMIFGRLCTWKFIVFMFIYNIFIILLIHRELNDTSVDKKLDTLETTQTQDFSERNQTVKLELKPPKPLSFEDKSFQEIKPFENIISGPVSEESILLNKLRIIHNNDVQQQLSKQFNNQVTPEYKATDKQYNTLPYKNKDHGKSDESPLTAVTSDVSVLNYTFNDLLFRGYNVHFLPGLRNPCFTVGGSENNDTSERFYCLPGFFLAGAEKSGSTDITNRLLFHHQVYGPQVQETHWFDDDYILRPIHKSKLGGYANMYNVVPSSDNDGKCNGTAVIFNCLKEKKNPTLCPYILGDFTPRYLSFGRFWEREPMHKYRREPLYLIPHKIKALLPSSKIIFILRNPTDRLFSSYKYFMLKPKFIKEYNITNPQEDFHNRVLGQMNKWNQCMSLRRIPFRSCLYGYPKDFDVSNFFFSPNSTDELRNGLYFSYIAEWLDVFPTTQILVINFEEYANDTIGVLQNYVLPFLGLDPFLPKDLERLKEIKIVHNKSQHPEEMWSETRELLNRFYSTENKKMSRLYPRFHNWT